MWVASNGCAHAGQATCPRLACACARAAPSRGTTMCGVDAHGKRANHSRKGSFVGWSGVEVGFGCNHSNRSGNTAVCHCLPRGSTSSAHRSLPPPHCHPRPCTILLCVHARTSRPDHGNCFQDLPSPAHVTCLPTVSSAWAAKLKMRDGDHTSRTQTRTTLAHVPRIAW